MAEVVLGSMGRCSYPTSPVGLNSVTYEGYPYNFRYVAELPGDSFVVPFWFCLSSLIRQQVIAKKEQHRSLQVSCISKGFPIGT